jgi:hypothetical protein
MWRKKKKRKISGPGVPPHFAKFLGLAVLDLGDMLIYCQCCINYTQSLRAGFEGSMEAQLAASELPATTPRNESCLLEIRRSLNQLPGVYCGPS